MTGDELDASILFIHNPLLRLWRTRALNSAFNAALSLAPEPVRRWLEHERKRARETERQERIQQRSRLIPEAEFRALVGRGLQRLIELTGRDRLGDYLEFGVYNGTSLTCAYRELRTRGLDHVRLFGFDSFKGLPPDADREDAGRWRPGSCHSPLSFTTSVLESEGVDLSRVTLVPGWFDETLNDEARRTHRIGKASVIMIDCDLYSSARAALNFCAPLIADHALLIFDEYRPHKLEEMVAGERKAFSEFLHEWGCFSAHRFGSYTRRAESFLVSRI